MQETHLGKSVFLHAQYPEETAGLQPTGLGLHFLGDGLYCGATGGALAPPLQLDLSSITHVRGAHMEPGVGALKMDDANCVYGEG